MEGGPELRALSERVVASAVRWASSEANAILKDRRRGLIHAAHRHQLSYVRRRLQEEPVLVNEANGSGTTLLHIACGRQLEAFATELVLTFGADVNALSNSRRTPLMLAAQNHPPLALRLLQWGAGKGAHWMSCNMKTAADYAQLSGHHSLEAELRKWEASGRREARERLDASLAADPQRMRCPTCDRRVNRRTKVHFLRKRVARGQEDNPLVAEFLRRPCSAALESQIGFHTLATMKGFTKEVSESMAILEELEAQLARLGLGPDSRFHVVDLCCGKSMTTAIACLHYRNSTVTALDRISHRSLPHYESVPNVEYLEVDLFSEACLTVLRARLDAVALPTLVLGLHLCGTLSTRAVEVAGASPWVRSLILMPCCTVCLNREAQADPLGFEPILSETTEAGKYRRWVEFLEHHMARALDGTVAPAWQHPHVKSPKNAIISCLLSAAGAHPSRRTSSV